MANIPGTLGMHELAMLTGKPYRTPGLPSTWHDVLSPEGRPMYWRREHTGYEVHPDGQAFRCELDGVVIAMRPSLTHAIVACRDHMHAAAELSSQRISNNEVPTCDSK